MKAPSQMEVAEAKARAVYTSLLGQYPLGMAMFREDLIAEIVAAVREGSAGAWHGDYWADYIERHFGEQSDG